MRHVERFCEILTGVIANPIALLLVIVAQAAWMIVGTISRKDPYPFLFMLTVSNVVQLIAMFVVAVAQRRSADHHGTTHEHLEAIRDVIEAREAS